MMKSGMWIMVLVLVLAGTLGCLSLTDPETGETMYGVTPKAAATVDTVAAAVETAGPAVVGGITAFNPVIGGIAGVVLGGLSTLITLWKKWRTPFVRLSGRYERVAMGARAAGDVIEHVVKPTAELWEKSRTELKSAEIAGAIMPDTL